LGLAAAVVFSLLYLIGALNSLEYNLYDFFLHFRAERERINDVVYLDVDDAAIAYYGIFPWPRSIPADGLLRLKEYGARASIFDIEYIDKGPQGVDSLYLDNGLVYDFERSFSEIDRSARDIFTSFETGRIARNDVNVYSVSLSRLINDKKNELFIKAQGVARDNDIYFAQAFSLFGRGWTTLNLRTTSTTGEEAQRRFIAEERFSIPVNVSPEAVLNEKYIDILPALPVFSEASKGAGFTNAEVDTDGVRRRIYLVRKIHDHWYRQLAFAPLYDYLGKPEIFIDKRKLTLKQASMPNGSTKDIVIPLDNHGCLLLDWPKEDYIDNFTHISFAVFSLLDHIEAELEMYSRALSSTELEYFAQFENSLFDIPVILNDAGELFDAARASRSYAMENSSDEAFKNYLDYRNLSHDLLGEIISIAPASKFNELKELLAEEYPDIASDIESEADYIMSLIDAIEINLMRYNDLTKENKIAFGDKFVIIGRVDTGTTDVGVNPFHGQYINVGTHGVVLDTILSESFITPLGIWWSIFIMLIIVPVVFHFSGKFTPVVRASSGFGAILIVLIGAILLFRFSGIFLGLFGFILAMIIAIIVREIIYYAGSEKEKHFIRTAFSTYVSSDVVKEIITDPSRLQLGGTKRHMTAIFTDVKGFSSISEKLDPEELVRLLNKYLSAMSDAILAEKGTIDKYEGDAIIAFFGAPLDLKDHALRACVSAIKIKKLELELNKTIMEQNLSPIPLITRIGINTGDMVAGNMGTANKMNYTIMGNAVNLAARLEGVNKQYGTWILASEDTIREAHTEGEILFYRKLDRVRVVGIDKPVRLCELIDLNSSAEEIDKKRITIFHEALSHFENREWKTAAEGFNEVLAIKADDETAKMYHERCQKFITTPPSASWDGVYNLTSK